jgi:VHL beta domain
MGAMRSSRAIPWLLFAACSPSVPSPPSAARGGDVVGIEPLGEGFFGKGTSWRGIVVEGHASVPDEALVEARGRVERMLGRAPRLLENLRQHRVEVHVLGRFQLVSDLPEHHKEKGTRFGGEDFDERTRGAGHQEGRFASCSEGNLLGFTGDRHYGHDACVHELAHLVMWRGMGPSLRARVLDRFRAALGEGRWARTYAATSEAEFFAELSMWYFGSSSVSAPRDAPPGRGAEWLRGYDAESFALVDAIYTDATDPGAARDVPLALHPPTEEGTVRAREARVPTTVTFVKRSPRPLRIVWLDYEGKRALPRVLSPGQSLVSYTFAGHPLLIADDSGSALGIVIAEADFGTVSVSSGDAGSPR